MSAISKEKQRLKTIKSMYFQNAQIPLDVLSLPKTRLSPIAIQLQQLNATCECTVNYKFDEMIVTSFFLVSKYEAISRFHCTHFVVKTGVI